LLGLDSLEQVENVLVVLVIALNWNAFATALTDLLNSVGSLAKADLRF
jgi:hypothetical protein